MKRFFCIICLLLLFLGVTQAQTEKPKSSGSPFSVYAGDVSWDTEFHFLENYAIYLDEHREYIGHIVYFSSEKISRRRIEARIRKSVKFLTKELKVPRNRLKIRYGGSSEDSKIVLQPIKPS